MSITTALTVSRSLCPSREWTFSTRSRLVSTLWRSPSNRALSIIGGVRCASGPQRPGGDCWHPTGTRRTKACAATPLAIAELRSPDSTDLAHRCSWRTQLTAKADSAQSAIHHRVFVALTALTRGGIVALFWRYTFPTYRHNYTRGFPNGSRTVPEPFLEAPGRAAARTPRRVPGPPLRCDFRAFSSPSSAGGFNGCC